jgi:hypothetical protein
VHASRLKLPVSELELDYGRRPEGSHSKLSTFRDGGKILWMFAMLMKETRPFAFFGILSIISMEMSIGFAIPVFAEFFETGLVTRMPSWVLSMALTMISFMLLTAGLILDSVARARAEQLRIHYMSLTKPSSRKSSEDRTAYMAELEKPASRKKRAKAA